MTVSEKEACVHTDNSEVFLYPQKGLGQGRHGTVYEATFYGTACVAKEMYRFKHQQAIDVSRRAFEKEMEIIKKLKHPNIIDLLDICHREDAPNSPILIMGKTSMTLNDFLLVSSDKSLLYNKMSMLHNIICGLHYLHKNGIIHRDLTVNAIYLTDNFCAKIADFGQATHQHRPHTKVPGEVSHMPPEALKENPQYTSKLDIFSFGCVVIHVKTNIMPIPIFDTKKMQPDGTYTPISEVERRRDLIEKLKDTNLHKIVEICLQDNPDSRPEASVLLSMIGKCKDTLPKSPESELSEKSKLELMREHMKLKSQEQELSLFTVKVTLHDHTDNKTKQNEVDKKQSTHDTKIMKVPLGKIVRQFYEQLVKTLPMDNPVFVASLNTQELFPDDTKDAVEAKETKYEKAKYFLDTVITCGIDYDDTYFKKLLNVMESSEYRPVQSLAKKIKDEMRMQKGNLKWKEELTKRAHELTIHLATVADQLVLYLRPYISEVEYHGIFYKGNAINKVAMLIDAICAREEATIYDKFCDAVKITKFNELSEELKSYLVN